MLAPLPTDKESLQTREDAPSLLGPLTSPSRDGALPANSAGN